MPTVLDYAKEDLHTKIQNLTRQLQASDNGRHLKCVATHPALDNPTVAMRQLEVLCKSILTLYSFPFGFYWVQIFNEGKA